MTGRDGDTRLAEIAADLDIVRREWGDDAQGLLPPDQSVVRLAAEVRRLHTENQRKAFCEHCGNYHPVIHHACCEPMMRANAERDAAVAALNRVRRLCDVPEHICTDTCEAFGCDNKGVTYIRSVQDILAAADVPDAAAAGETG